MVFNSDIHISGDVRIDDHAVIAPGVVILAAPNYSVAIAAGACLGMGCIVQADQGNIDIQEGAMVGAGVLIIGSASIGANSCVGYGSTLLKTIVEAGAVLPPNSLIGDQSRKVINPNPNPNPKTTTHPQTTTSSPEIPPQEQPVASESSDPWATAEEKIASSTPKTTEPITEPTTKPIEEKIEPREREREREKEREEVGRSPVIQEEIIPEISEIAEVTPESIEEQQNETPKEPVVGQVYINQLLMTLFPHKTPINPSN